MADLILFHHVLGTVREFFEQVVTREEAELFLYPGSSHLVTDSSLPDYDRESSELVLERTLAFLRGLAGSTPTRHPHFRLGKTPFT